ncbi:MAG: PEP-CTERM sorting domain-containing protein [Akkermansiaceae bacterium]|nr:PEP-CTERM sorting domain-containing protein [Akkermansiaceae bacterium]
MDRDFADQSLIPNGFPAFDRTVGGPRCPSPCQKASPSWSDGDLNAGFYLLFSSTSSVTLQSDDSATAANRPLLTVDFTLVPEPSGTALLGLAGLAFLLCRRR